MDDNKPVQKAGPKLGSTLPVDSVINNPNVLKIYANGFALGHSFVDATMVIQQGSMPLATVTMPFVSLKALHKAIGETIAKIEAGLGQSLPDIRETSEKWAENTEKAKQLK